MCCFSGRVEKVADTHIFARASTADRQYLVYSMFLAMRSELAMILPIPTPKGSKEEAVRFIDLSGHPHFFADLEKGFPKPPPPRDTKGLEESAPESKLKVVTVGSFEASFVPAIKDFPRLDERFRLPTEVWNALPTYQEYGFAVFKLRKGEMKVHPMAFEFPRADRTRLFFPTVHIHDGKVHKTALFDHVLYCQGKPTGGALRFWKESARVAGAFMDTRKTRGIVDGKAHLYRLGLSGRKTNQDTWVS